MERLLGAIKSLLRLRIVEVGINEDLLQIFPQSPPHPKLNVYSDDLYNSYDMVVVAPCQRKPILSFRGTCPGSTPQHHLRLDVTKFSAVEREQKWRLPY